MNPAVQVRIAAYSDPLLLDTRLKIAKIRCNDGFRFGRVYQVAERLGRSGWKREVRRESKQELLEKTWDAREDAELQISHWPGVLRRPRRLAKDTLGSPCRPV